MKLGLVSSLAVSLLLISLSALAELRAVRVDTANFREGPSKSEEIIYTADRYYAVEVLETRGKWVKTRDFEGEEAWVAGWLLSKTPAVVVKVECAIVRADPDRKSAKLFKLERGEGMRVLGKKGPWIHIEDAQGRKGWIHRDVLWGAVH